MLESVLLPERLNSITPDVDEESWQAIMKFVKVPWAIPVRVRMVALLAPPVFAPPLAKTDDTPSQSLQFM
jgi:hypothetical protein